MNHSAGPVSAALAGTGPGSAGVGQDHEVVLGAVALGELALAKFVLGELTLGEWLLGGRHLSMVASAWAGRSAPGPASSQITRGSRPNHDSWRRANRRVALTVCSRASSSSHSPARNLSTWA